MFSLVAPSYTIGRADENDIVFSGDRAMSRRHARIDRSPTGDWLLADSGSSNGTFVNGIRVNRPVKLRAEDHVVVGDSHFTFVPDVALESMLRTSVTTDTPESQRGIKLTPRESEIIRHVGGGMSDQEVAQSLGISAKTVQSYLDRIKNKTGVRRRAELARLAALLDQPD